MRLALFHNLPNGGAKRALYEWIKRLSITHEVEVFSLSTADHSFCDIRPFVQEHNVFEFIPHREFAPPWGRLNRLQRWRDLNQLTCLGHHIAQEINTRGYDIVFAQPCQFTFIPNFLSFVQIPSVYYLHEPFGPTFVREIQRPYCQQQVKWRELSKQLDPFFVLYSRRLENIRTESIKKTTCLLANSRFTQQHMKRQYGVDALVSSLGIDVTIFRPLPGIPKENNVLSVGELTPRKGFDFLIESLAYIPPERRPALKLVCNWVDPTEMSYLQELAIRSCIELYILVGLNNDQLVLEYNKAKLCIYAPVLEPLGFIPLESMACGTPVVGVAEGGICETIRHGETGLLTAREPKQFAEAILKLMTNPPLLEQMGQRGPDYVRDNWSWDSSVAQLETHLLATANGVCREVKTGSGG